MAQGRKVLIGLDEIMEFLKISRPTFYKFLKLGMPARLVNKRWYAHEDNINDFFKRFTIPGPGRKGN
jgi:hypothetical protein